MVEVWWASAAEAAAAANQSVLSKAEQRRLLAYKRPADRQRFLAARSVVRNVLGKRLDLAPQDVPLQVKCLECAGPHGPVHLPASVGLHLSIAHSGQHVAVALSAAGPVGIDVEDLLDAPVTTQELWPLALHPHEQQVMSRLGDDTRSFLVYWTRKEALLKATGQGLKLDMATVWVSPPGDPARVHTPPVELGGTLQLRDLDRHSSRIGAVALRADGPFVVEEYEYSSDA